MNNAPVDIVIVGAGLVGASLACVLARKHPQLSIGLVEASDKPVALPQQGFDPRVVALTRQSQTWLDQAGVWQAIEDKRACPYQRMQVWDAEGTASIDFNAQELGEPNIGHIVENSLAVSLLHKQTQLLDNIAWFKGAGVEQLLLDDAAGSNRLLLSGGQVVQARLIVAADGANSTLRQLAALATREWDYDHSAIVTTVRCEKPHQYTAWQRFMPTGPLAFLPLQDDQSSAQHYCSIVWSAQTDLAERLLAEDDEVFCQSLTRAFESTLGQVLSVDRRYGIPLRQRHAVDYARKGLVLVGDAAHSIHPLAGQGVNLGFADVVALAAEIDRALGRDLDLSDFSILRRYQRQRKADNLIMMSAMEGFKRLFGSRDLSITWLRNQGLNQVASLPVLKNMIARQALGLGL